SAVEVESQLVCVGTPGISAARRRRGRAMVTSAWTGAHDADIVALMIDAKCGIDPETEAILHRLADVAGRKLVILNKVDLVAKPTLLALAQDANARAPFGATFMVSALSGDGIGDLKAWLPPQAPEGPWARPEEPAPD